MKYKLESSEDNITITTDEGVGLEFMGGVDPVCVVIDGTDELDFYNEIERAVRFKIDGEILTLLDIRQQVQRDAAQLYAETRAEEREEAEHIEWLQSPEKTGRI